MASLSEFFAMGGYAPFVWPAFAVTAIVMLGLLIFSRRALHANAAMLEALERDRRGPSGNTPPATASPQTQAETEGDT